MVKRGIFWFFAILILLMPLAFASLQINVTPETDTVVQDISQPAKLNLELKNLGSTDNFEMYTIISGIIILPRSPFIINSGATLSLPIEIQLSENAKRNLGWYSFSYQIKGQATAVQNERMTIKIVALEDALEIVPDSIRMDSPEAFINLKNKENVDLENLEFEFKSVFFDEKQIVSIKANETKKISVKLGDIKKYIAGLYTLTVIAKTETKTHKFEGEIKLIEKSGLSTEDRKSGFVITSRKIIKTNEGNLPVVAEISAKKNIISRLVTTFNIDPDRVNRKLFYVTYYWQNELKPTEKLEIIITTNWTFPLIILIAIIIIAALVYYFTMQDVIIRKRVTFVKTKSDDFALKVWITVKSRGFVEKIRVIDKLPVLAKLYEKFGAISPSKIDEQNRRIMWDIENLNAGEERNFSYVIYSKIGIVGKFALPSAVAVYEKEGKIKEAESNKVFFVSERRQLKEE